MSFEVLALLETSFGQRWIKQIVVPCIWSAFVDLLTWKNVHICGIVLCLRMSY